MWLYFSCWWMISDQTCVITSFLSWAWWKDPLSCLNDEYEATSTSKARLTQQEYLKTTAVINTQCPATVSTWSGSGKDGLALKTHFLNQATRAAHPPAGRASSWLWLSDTYVLRLLHAFIANWWYHTFKHTLTFIRMASRATHVNPWVCYETGHLKNSRCNLHSVCRTFPVFQCRFSRTNQQFLINSACLELNKTPKKKQDQVPSTTFEHRKPKNTGALLFFMRHIQTASGKTITNLFKLKERTNHYI